MPQINGYEFTIGADPEFFVTQAGQLVSAYGLIGGTKEKPQKVKGGAIQVDGMALEFNINPAKNLKAFEENIEIVMEEIKRQVPGYDFAIQPVAEFGETYIRRQPKEASRLGCDPDYNAYTGKLNPVPNAKAGFRTASGHIHIGWQKEPIDPHEPTHMEACIALTKTLDYYLGAPFILIDEGVKRRELYGQAGAFRPKPYGMEYRVLSNCWLDPQKPWLKRMVWENTVQAIKDLFSSPDVQNTITYVWNENGNDCEGYTAQKIINNNLKEVVPFLFRDGKVHPFKKFREAWEAEQTARNVKKSCLNKSTTTLNTDINNNSWVVWR